MGAFLSFWVFSFFGAFACRKGLSFEDFALQRVCVYVAEGGKKKK
jgi:hypothetical protein